MHERQVGGFKRVIIMSLQNNVSIFIYKVAIRDIIYCEKKAEL